MSPSFGTNWDPGVCGDISNYPAIHPSWCPWLRVVLKPEGWPELAGKLNKASAEGFKVLGVVARESMSENGELIPNHRWAEWIDGYLYDGALDHTLPAIQIGNEPDLDSESSWTMTPSMFSVLLGAAVDVVKAGTKVIAGGLASGQPPYLEQVKNLGGLEGVHAVAIHPYGKIPHVWVGDLYKPQASGQSYVSLVESYWNVLWDQKCKLWITEFGARTDEIGLKYQSLYLHDMARDEFHWGSAEVVFQFCLDHAMVRGYGMYEDGVETRSLVGYRRGVGRLDP